MMSTGIQTANGELSFQQVQMLRGVGKAGHVVLLMLILGRPTGATETARILDISRETAANYLDSLCVTGLVTRLVKRDGYCLTNDGRQLMMQVPGGYLLEDTLRTSEIPTFIDENPQETHKPNVGIIDVQNNTNIRTSEFPTFNVGNSDVRTGSSSEEEEDINLNNKNTNLLQSEPENTDLPPIKKLLDAMDYLRGNKNDPNAYWSAPAISDIPKNTTSKYLLTWIVKAYTDRERLNSPVGRICSMMKKPEKRSLPQDWRERMPPDFLSELGIEHTAPSEPDNKVLSAVEQFLRRR